VALQGSNEPCPEGPTFRVVQNAIRFVLQLELFGVYRAAIHRVQRCLFLHANNSGYSIGFRSVFQAITRPLAKKLRQGKAGLQVCINR
ncbi:hypothetical protein, partial [Dickeya undicola]